VPVLCANFFCFYLFVEGKPIYCVVPTFFVFIYLFRGKLIHCFVFVLFVDGKPILLCCANFFVFIHLLRGSQLNVLCQLFLFLFICWKLIHCVVPTFFIFICLLC
jgi:hypothetical protein